MNKIVRIIGIMMIIVLIMSTCIYAAGEDIITGMNPSGNAWGTNNTGFIGKTLGMVLGVLQVVGVAVTIISIVIAGIKYMTSSVNDKATIKQQAIPLVVGGVIMFSASTILKLISGFTSQVLK